MMECDPLALFDVPKEHLRGGGGTMSSFMKLADNYDIVSDMSNAINDRDVSSTNSSEQDSWDDENGTSDFEAHAREKDINDMFDSTKLEKCHLLETFLEKTDEFLGTNTIKNANKIRENLNNTLNLQDIITPLLNEVFEKFKNKPDASSLFEQYRNRLQLIIEDCHPKCKDLKARLDDIDVICETNIKRFLPHIKQNLNDEVELNNIKQSIIEEVQEAIQGKDRNESICQELKTDLEKIIQDCKKEQPTQSPLAEPISTSNMDRTSTENVAASNRAIDEMEAKEQRKENFRNALNEISKRLEGTPQNASDSSSPLPTNMNPDTQDTHSTGEGGATKDPPQLSSSPDNDETSTSVQTPSRGHSTPPLPTTEEDITWQLNAMLGDLEQVHEECKQTVNPFGVGYDEFKQCVFDKLDTLLERLENILLSGENEVIRDTVINTIKSTKDIIDEKNTENPCFLMRDKIASLKTLKTNYSPLQNIINELIQIFKVDICDKWIEEYVENEDYVKDSLSEDDSGIEGSKTVQIPEEELQPTEENKNKRLRQKLLNLKDAVGKKLDKDKRKNRELEKERQSLLQQLEDVHAELARKTRELENIQKQLDSNTSNDATIEELKDENIKEQQRYQELRQTLDIKKEELKRANIQNMEFENIASDVSTMIDSTEREMIELNYTITRQKQEIERRHRQNTRQTMKIRKMSKKRNELEAQVREFERLNDDLKHTISNLQTEFDSLTHDYNTKSKKYQKNVAKLEVITTQKRTCDAKIIQLQSDIREKESQLATAQQSIQTLTTDNETKQTQLDTYQQSIHTLRTDNETKQIQLEQLQQKQEEQTNQIEALKGVINSAIGSLERTETKINSIHTQLRDKIAEHNDLQKRYNTLQTINEKLREGDAAKDVEIQRLGEDLQRQTAILNALSTRSDQKSRELGEARAQRDRLGVELDDLNKKLTFQTNETRRIETALTEKQHEIEKLQRTLNATFEQMSEQSDDIARVDSLERQARGHAQLLDKRHKQISIYTKQLIKKQEELDKTLKEREKFFVKAFDNETLIKMMKEESVELMRTYNKYMNEANKRETKLNIQNKKLINHLQQQSKINAQRQLQHQKEKDTLTQQNARLSSAVKNLREGKEVYDTTQTAPSERKVFTRTGVTGSTGNLDLDRKWEALSPFLQEILASPRYLGQVIRIYSKMSPNVKEIIPNYEKFAEVNYWISEAINEDFDFRFEEPQHQQIDSRKNIQRSQRYLDQTIECCKKIGKILSFPLVDCSKLRPDLSEKYLLNDHEDMWYYATTQTLDKLIPDLSRKFKQKVTIGLPVDSTKPIGYCSVGGFDAFSIMTHHTSVLDNQTPQKVCFGSDNKLYPIHVIEQAYDFSSSDNFYESAETILQNLSPPNGCDMRDWRCFEALVVAQVAKMVKSASSEVLVIFPLCMYPGSQFFDYHQVVRAYRKAISAVISNKSLVQPKVIVLCFPEGFEDRAEDLNRHLRPLNKQKVKQAPVPIPRYVRRTTKQQKLPPTTNYVNPSASTVVFNPERSTDQMTVDAFKNMFNSMPDISF